MKRDHTLNDSVFNTIDNDESAYWIGFLAADGWISKNSLGFALKRSDRDAIERFKNFLETDKEIVDYESKCNNGNSYPTSRIIVNSSELIGDLSKYGIVPAKSYMDIDFLKYIPDKYKMAFIFGYLSGDGGIGKNSDVSITGNKKLIISILAYLGVETKVRELNDIGTCIATICGEKKGEFLYNYILFNNNVVVLERKLNRAIDFVNRKHRVSRSTGLTKTNECKICRCTISDKGSLCKNCIYEMQRSHIPPKEQLENLLEEGYNYEDIGRQFGFTGKTVANWLKGYGLYEKKKPDTKHISVGDMISVFICTLSINDTANELMVGDWVITENLDRLIPEYSNILLKSGRPVKYRIGLEGDKVHVFKSVRDAARSIGNIKQAGHIMDNANKKRAGKVAGKSWEWATVDEYTRYVLNNPSHPEYDIFKKTCMPNRV